MTDTARVIVEVSGGLIPGEAIAEFTRRWVISTDEWAQAQTDDEHADDAHAFHAYLLLAGRAAIADEYARALRDPRRLNWVRTDWIWL